MQPEPVPQLPSEVWFHIFSYLTPEALVKVSIVDHNFYFIANEQRLWQKNIEKYFPFFKKKNDKLMDLEITGLSAKHIFQKICERHQKTIKILDKYQITASLLLASMRRDMPFKNYFSYCTSLACIPWLGQNATSYHRGHPPLWSLSTVVTRAAINNTFEKIYPAINSEITVEMLDRALVIAARKGYYSLIKYILKIDKTMWINKGKAFKIACGHNHFTIAEYLLYYYASSITSVDKGWALRWGFIKKHHGIVKYLLREFSHTFNFFPLLKKESWSTAFRLNDFYILIEKNGRRFSGETHLFFFQLNNKKIFYLELNHIKRIALLLQRKCFPIQRWDDPDFHKSYCCIMGSPTHNCLPAHIYCVGNLIPSEQVKQSFNVATPEINQPELSIVINYGKSLTPVFDTMKLDPFSNIPKEKYLQIDKGILPESVVNLLLTKHSSGKRA